MSVVAECNEKPHSQGVPFCLFIGYSKFQSFGLFRGCLRLFLFFWGASLGLFMVGLGSVWGKSQILGLLKGLLKIVLIFLGLVFGAI